MKYLLYLLFATSAYAEIDRFDFLKKDLIGVALYRSEMPFIRDAKLRWSISKDERWKAPKAVESMTSTHEQIVFFYRNPKNVSAAQDVEQGIMVVAEKFVWTVENDIAIISLDGNQSKDALLKISLKKLLESLDLDKYKRSPESE